MISVDVSLYAITKKTDKHHFCVKKNPENISIILKYVLHLIPPKHITIRNWAERNFDAYEISMQRELCLKSSIANVFRSVVRYK